MIKKERKILTIAAIIFAVAIIVSLILVFALRDKTNTEIDDPTLQTEQTSPISSTDPTLPELENAITSDDPSALPDDITDVGGLPVEYFESTARRNFALTLKNVKADYLFTMTTETKWSDFKYEFSEAPLEPGELPIEDAYRMIEPGKTDLRVKSDYDAHDDSLCFGGLNETNKATDNFDEMTVVYIQYRGSSNWELCGINTNMSKDDVRTVLGEPSREYDMGAEYYMEYFVLNDMHSYTITVTFDSDNGEMKLIELLRDNLPVYEGQGITEEEYQAMLKAYEEWMAKQGIETEHNHDTENGEQEQIAQEDMQTQE